MGKAVLLSLNPKWFEPIMQGKKTKEVRKRAPLIKHPYKVYLYCTKNGEIAYRAGVKGKFKPYQMNGTICGEFTCVSTVEQTPPFKDCMAGTYLTAREFYSFLGESDKMSFMLIKDPILYDKPKTLADFGLKYPPQSWRYVEEPDE